MSCLLKARVRLHGTKNAYAGDEPRNDELTAHWKQWPEKCKRPRKPAPPKRTAKLRRKDQVMKRAADKAYRARLAAPWPIFVAVKEER